MERQIPLHRTSYRGGEIAICITWDVYSGGVTCLLGIACDSAVRPLSPRLVTGGDVSNAHALSLYARRTPRRLSEGIKSLGPVRHGGAAAEMLGLVILKLRVKEVKEAVPGEIRPAICNSLDIPLRVHRHIILRIGEQQMNMHSMRQCGINMEPYGFVGLCEVVCRRIRLVRPLDGT